MTIILDTHTFLWFIAGDAKLSPHARSLIEDPGNRVLLSIVSLWEIVVKAKTGKLPLSRSFSDLIRHDVDGNGIEVLPTTVAHLESLTLLPAPPPRSLRPAAHRSVNRRRISNCRGR